MSEAPEVPTVQERIKSLLSDMEYAAARVSGESSCRVKWSDMYEWIAHVKALMWASVGTNARAPRASEGEARFLEAQEAIFWFMNEQKRLDAELSADKEFVGSWGEYVMRAYRSWRASLLEKGGPDAPVAVEGAVVRADDPSGCEIPSGREIPRTRSVLDSEARPGAGPSDQSADVPRTVAPIEKGARFSKKERETLEVCLAVMDKAAEQNAVRIFPSQRPIVVEAAKLLKAMLDGDDTPGGKERGATP